MTYLLEIINRAALRPNGNLFFCPSLFCHFFYCYKKLSQGGPSIPSSFPSCELNPKSFKLTSQTLLGSR